MSGLLVALSDVVDDCLREIQLHQKRKKEWEDFLSGLTTSSLDLLIKGTVINHIRSEDYNLAYARIQAEEYMSLYKKEVLKKIDR